MYDATKVLGINKKLAEKYIIDSDNLIGSLNIFPEQMAMIDNSFFFFVIL